MRHAILSFFILCGAVLSAVPAMADDDVQAARATALALLDSLTEEGTEPGTYPAAARDAFRAAIEAATTTDDITAATTAYKAAVNTVTISTDTEEVWYYLVSGPSRSYCQGSQVYDMSVSSGEQVKWNDASVAERAMWKFVKPSASSDRLKLVNKATGRALRTTGTSGAAVTSVDKLSEGTAFDVVSLGEQRAFVVRQGSKYPIHADQHGVMVTWNDASIGSASVWHFNAVAPQDIALADTLNDGYELVWSDEFNGITLNTNHWGFETGFVRNQEPQWYQTGNVQVTGGNLVITAKKQRVKNPNYDASSDSWKKNREYAEYTSSSIRSMTKLDMLYGRLEVRAKIPTTSGAWPAIWCLGYEDKTGAWPACGEIDILEFYNNSIFANLCWSNEWGSDQWRAIQTSFSHFTAQDANWSDKYHTWRMDWDSTAVRIYLDNELLNVTNLDRTEQVVNSRNLTANPFRTRQYVLLNLALRSADGIDESYFPLKYYVDYVRCYKAKKVPTGLQRVESLVAQNWLQQSSDGAVVDLRAFTATPTITVLDLAGRVMAQYRPTLATSIFNIPPTHKGLCIVRATDGQHAYAAKVMMR